MSALFVTFPADQGHRASLASLLPQHTFSRPYPATYKSTDLSQASFLSPMPPSRLKRSVLHDLAIGSVDRFARQEQLHRL